MPGHLYLRTGDYMASVRTNELAAEADEKYLETSGKRGTMYDLMYYNHNLHFIAVSNTLAGRLTDARSAADRLVKNASKGVEGFPILEFFLPTPTLVLMEFHRWDDVLKLPQPDSKLAMTNAFWRFARASAFAAKGDVKSADGERAKLEKLAGEIPDDADFGAYFNKAHVFLDIMGNVLEARIASAKGKRDAAIEAWEKAVKLEDGLNYGEPPEWYGPIRESLGAELLRAGKSREAEEVFRADLERNPRNGRSLFGLWKSLEAQKKVADAALVRQQFDAAWKDAEVKLRIEEL
jgi:tetratricopeptide (TPR) repeat protein